MSESGKQAGRLVGGLLPLPTLAPKTKLKPLLAGPPRSNFPLQSPEGCVVGPCMGSAGREEGHPHAFI